MRCLLVFLSLASAVAWQPVSRVALPKSRQESNSVRQPEAVAASIFPVVLACTLAVSPAAALDSSVYNNEYADPLHPFCDRKIEVSKNGRSFHYSGRNVADDGAMKGCSREEIKAFTLETEEFDGQIIDGRISTGDGIHDGVWEPKNTANTNFGFEDVDGIRWKDGNKWIVASQARVLKNEAGKYEVTKKPLTVVIGEYIFYSYIGFSTLAGVKGLIDGIKRKQQQT